LLQTSGLLDSRHAVPLRDVPLVGRKSELNWIAQARTGGAVGVVVHAPAGVGKSRLARAALAQVEVEGARTTWVQATRSAASVPLGAFAGAIRADVGSDDPFELLRRSVRAPIDAAEGHSLVVGVDDAQLLDPTSAALVLELTGTPSAFVLATVRSRARCDRTRSAISSSRRKKYWRRRKATSKARIRHSST
jgi:hypothetical protein